MNSGHIDTMQIKPRRKPRVNYSVEFKAQIVAQCLLPHVSIASIARTHNLNANVLHRWVREHEKSAALSTHGYATRKKQGHTAPHCSSTGVILPFCKGRRSVMTH